LRVKSSLKSKGWSNIHLRKRRAIGPIRQIGMTPPTWIICVREWVIGQSRVIGADIVDLVTSILGKWTLDLIIDSQMANRLTYFT